MAKIEKIKLFPKHVGKQQDPGIQEITVKIWLRFHPVDIQIKLKYHLHILLLNIPSSFADPILYPNMDQGNIIIDTKEFRDSFLGLSIFSVKATRYTTTVTRTITLNMNGFPSLNGLRAFGSMVPVLAQASKWSNPYVFDIVLE